MKLIMSLTSPFARKVRVVMAEKRIDYEPVVDIPWEPTTRVPEYNPLGKVPVLVMDDGSTLFDSRVIVEYLDHLTPVSPLLAQGASSAHRGAALGSAGGWRDGIRCHHFSGEKTA